MPNTKTTFNVWLKNGDVITIDAQSEKHARQAISRGRKVGRYASRIVKVEPATTKGLAEDTFNRIEQSNAAQDRLARR